MKIKYFMIDVEAIGQCPNYLENRMTEFGCVIVSNPPEFAFWGIIEKKGIFPNSKTSLIVVEPTDILSYQERLFITMRKFSHWIETHCLNDFSPVFISDNNGWDYQWINWAFHSATGSNPFGHSSQNLGSLYKGKIGTMKKNFKHLRKTKHTHNPVDDALGNVEALITIVNEFKIDGII